MSHLQYTYPRLDAEDYRYRDHLLKAPFCAFIDPANIALIRVAFHS